MTILISDPDQDWANRLSTYLGEKSLLCEHAFSGRECQSKIFKKEYEVLILDFDTTNHSALEVLRYMKLGQTKTKVVLTFSNKERFKELDLKKEDLLRLGASEVFIKPFSLDALYRNLQGENQFQEWKKLNASKQVSAEQELTAVDEEFTHVKADSFSSGNTTIFDLYIRIARNRYIKILHKGDFFDEDRLKKYTEKHNVEYLYFKTKDRGIYINYVNDLLTKALASGKGTTEQRMKATKNVAEKFIEEIYTNGLRPQLIEEGKAVCENIYNFVQRDRGLADVLREYEDYDPPAYAHLFLTSFLSTIISKNLEWTSNRTVEMTAMAGLLHDIGMLKLPKELWEIPTKRMTPKQLEQYKLHPLYGVQMLEKFSSIPEPVRQIIYQHHEWINGEGFPNGLTGTKIYPLAKVTSLANEFSNFLVEKRVAPLKGLREFISDREMLMRFDSVALKSLVQGFVKEVK